MQEIYGENPQFIPKRRRKSEKSAKKVSKFLVIFFAAAFLFGVIFCVCSFSDEQEDAIVFLPETWYFVIVSVPSDGEEAQIKATAVRARGGAGYIINDGKYNIAAAVYDKRVDAESVCARMDGAFVCERTATGKKLALSDAALAEKQTRTLVTTAIIELSELLYSFETAELSEAALTYAVSGWREKINRQSLEISDELPILSSQLSEWCGALSECERNEDGLLNGQLRYALCLMAYEKGNA